MTLTYAEASLTEFAEKLSAKTSTPGGGAACAYTAVLGAALNEMVGNFTVGKEKYADNEPEIVELMDKTSGIRTELMHLVDCDAAAFNALKSAYAMPKETLERSLAVEAALKGAAEVPISVMRLSEELMKIAVRLSEIGNQSLVSDAGCALELCLAAVKASLMNVTVNTESMTDRTVAECIESEAKDIANRCQELEAGVYRKLTDKN